VVESGIDNRQVYSNGCAVRTRKNIANPILVTGTADRVGRIGRTVTELLLKQGKTVRAMVGNEDERAYTRRGFGRLLDCCTGPISSEWQTIWELPEKHQTPRRFTSN
jgi:hypothetical protein